MCAIDFSGVMLFLSCTWYPVSDELFIMRPAVRGDCTAQEGTFFAIGVRTHAKKRPRTAAPCTIV